FEADDMRRLDENRPMVDAWSRNWPPSLAERFSPTGPPIDYPKTEAQPNIQPTDIANLAFQDKNIKQKIESAVVADVLNQVQGSQRSEVFQEVENVLRPRNISGLITLDAKQDKVKQAPESDPKSFSFDDRVDSLLNGLLTINQDTADHNLELINQVISTMPSEQGAIYQKDLRFLIVSNQHSSRFIGRVDDFQIILPIPIPDPNIDKEVWHAIEIGEHIEPKIWKKMTDQQKEENIKLMKIRILSQRQKLIDEAKEAKLQSINKAMEMYLVFVQAHLAKKYGKEKAQQMLTRESHVLGTEVDYDFRFTRLGQGNAMMILHLNVHNPLIEPEQ
ncbi:hypothetical protein KKG46_02820, partial [Patescibacteria group bacterium]|nr:hypothetical protein [Patescibacteria group bacterium]